MNLVEVVRGVVLFLLALFLAVSVFAFSAFSAARVVLTPEFYVETLQESNSFEALPAALSSSLKIPQFSAALSNPQLVQGMKKQVYLLLDNLFSYLNGKSASPNLVIETAALKAALPLAASLPDSIDLVKQQPGLADTLLQARQMVSTLNTAYWAFLIALMVFVVVVFLLSWNLRRGMKWTGFAFVLGSAVALLAFMAAPQVVTSMAQQQLTQLPAGSALRPVLDVAVRKVVGGGNAVAGVFFIAGLALLAAGFLWKKQAPRTQNTVS